MPNGKTFMKVTNKQIFIEIQDLKKEVSKVNTIRWMAGTSLSISVFTIGLLARYIGV